MMIWAGHVPRIAKIHMCKGFLFGNVEENDRLEDQKVDRNIVIKTNLKVAWENVDWIPLN
jgi:hypothetical protein